MPRFDKCLYIRIGLALVIVAKKFHGLFGFALRIGQIVIERLGFPTNSTDFHLLRGFRILIIAPFVPVFLTKIAFLSASNLALYACHFAFLLCTGKISYPPKTCVSPDWQSCHIVISNWVPFVDIRLSAVTPI